MIIRSADPRSVIIALLIAALALLSLATFIPTLTKPFTLDETEESLMGWKLATVGPRTYLPHDMGGEGMDLTHSLLYTYSHALVQKIFGHSELPLRLYGMCLYFVSLGILIPLICRLIPGGTAEKAWGAVIGAALYLVDPLLIQHAVVVNSDNSLLALALILFGYFFIRFEQEKRFDVVPRLALAGLFALALWVKEVTPLFALFGILIYRLASGDRKGFFRDLIFVGIAGLLLFWATWGVYCLFTKTDVLGFVKFTIINKSKHAFSAQYFANLGKTWLARWRWPVYWVSAPFYLALLLFIGRRVAAVVRREGEACVDIVFLIGLGLWVPYYFFKPNMDMMKYQYPAYLFFIASLAWLFADALMRRSPEPRGFSRSVRPAELAGALLIIVIAVFHYYRLGDYLLALWAPMHEHLNGHFLIYYFLPIAAILSILAFASGRKRLWRNLACTAVLLAIPVNIGLDLNQMRATYNTVEIWLNYGESGMMDALDYVASHMRPNAVVSVRADLEYHLVVRKGAKIRQNITPDIIFPIESPKVFEAVVSKLPSEYVVLHGILRFVPVTKEKLLIFNKYYALEKQCGDFFIYRRR